MLEDFDDATVIATEAFYDASENIPDGGGGAKKKTTL